ncbi:MAG: BamA/TamA family outer membrane protein [Bacteroidaceae bacterium]|nr:BamA/TamA family outer membrane protein [Bacteroidaceae bacterium]
MAVLLSSCSVSRYLPEDAYLLDEVKVVSGENPKVVPSLKSKVRQHPNIRTFGLIRLPLWLYSMSGERDNFVNRTLRNVGEAPRAYNDTLTRRSCEAMEQTLINQGYLKASVSAEAEYHKRTVKVNYYAHPGQQYRVASVHYVCLDSVILGHVLEDSVNSPIKVGVPFDAGVLNSERIRLATLLQGHGYYGFKKEYITYVADTARNSTDVALSIRVRSGVFTQEGGDGDPVYKAWKKYSIENVKYLMYPSSFAYQPMYVFPDTACVGNEYFLYDNRPPFRFAPVRYASHLAPGMVYDVDNVKKSYMSYGRLSALKYTNINFVENSDSTLDCYITLNPAKKISMSTEVDFTNTAGDVGASASLSFTHRNLFNGSETFMVKLRGAYENITHLADYESGRFLEYGVDMGLNFPRFIAPFVPDDVQRRSMATTQLDLQYNAQTRPEFDRNVFSASWSYLWNSSKQIRHRFDLVGVNFVSVPRKDKNFISNYLDKYNSKNSIMKFNYEDLFIFRTGYDFYYTSPNAGVTKDYFDISHSVRASVETSGNLLSLVSNALNLERDSIGQYRFFNLAYAQYLKTDLAWTMNMNLGHRNHLLFHVESGVAYPYGNSRMLPFEKRYYAGGANGVRGWAVRGLGPGRYVSQNGTIDYINQSGDIKLDLSLEYRMHMFWKIDGALFIDAGNIWTMYNYDDQPGGVFLWDEFYKQIAVSYGAGIRLDLNFLVLRLDAGMKAINPIYEDGPLRYPIVNPRFGRDFAWHFAVGYPF